MASTVAASRTRACVPGRAEAEDVALERAVPRVALDNGVADTTAACARQAVASLVERVAIVAVILRHPSQQAST